MYQICESSSFMWSTKDYLGEGATATVYQGMSKLNGDLVAVKCYKDYMIQPEYQLREFEVLRKINHENIVKFIGVEETLAERKYVIVTELCNGGCLMNDLLDPRNKYGLEESEFLIVLKHLCGGIKYLQDNNIVHRDIKPGNIMKCIEEDGTNVYKLTDFGAARELPESKTFQSLCGTPQYLHPDVYEPAVLGRRTKKRFNSSVDLWSIGVTLYHILTGMLPFKAYKGHKSRETMHYITTKKESGVISGVQNRENGPITWSRKLPETCPASDFFKEDVTPILAGVLEVDKSKIWGFEKFFNAVNILLSYIVINIFYVNKAKLVKMYLLPDQTYEDLERCITANTKIEGFNQILLYKDNDLKNYVQEFTRVCEYPMTSEDNPLFLFNKENDDISTLDNHIEIPQWTDFPTNISLQEDSKLAKCACTAGYFCKRQIDKYSLYCKLINDSVQSLIEYIDNDLKLIQLAVHHLFEKIRVYEKTGRLLRETNTCSSSSKLENISKDFVAATELVRNLYNLQCFENTMKSDWDSTNKDFNSTFTTCASARGETHVKELCKSWQYFLNESRLQNLSLIRSQWYILERKKVGQRLCSIRALLEKETFPRYHQMAKCFENWYKSAQIMYERIYDLKANIEQFEKKLKDFENELTATYDNPSKNRDQVDKNHKTEEKLPKIIYSKSYLRNYVKNNKNFDEILSENTKLMNQIQDFKCMKL